MSPNVMTYEAKAIVIMQAQMSGKEVEYWSIISGWTPRENRWMYSLEMPGDAYRAGEKDYVPDHS